MTWFLALRSTTLTAVKGSGQKSSKTVLPAHLWPLFTYGFSSIHCKSLVLWSLQRRSLKTLTIIRVGVRRGQRAGRTAGHPVSDPRQQVPFRALPDEPDDSRARPRRRLGERAAGGRLQHGHGWEQDVQARFGHRAWPRGELMGGVTIEPSETWASPDF